MNDACYRQFRMGVSTVEAYHGKPPEPMHGQTMLVVALGLSVLLSLLIRTWRAER